MSAWLPAALLALLSFGLWGFFTKLAVLHIDFKSALIYQTIGVVLIGILTLSTMDYKPMPNGKGLSFSVLTGVAYALGCLFYFLAASRGKIITVVTLTSLYPLITILLAFLLLKESVNIKQCAGILFAIVSIILMSI